MQLDHFVQFTISPVISRGCWWSLASLQRPNPSLCLSTARNIFRKTGRSPGCEVGERVSSCPPLFLKDSSTSLGKTIYFCGKWSTGRGGTRSRLWESFIRTGRMWFHNMSQRVLVAILGDNTFLWQFRRNHECKLMVCQYFFPPSFLKYVFSPARMLLLWHSHMARELFEAMAMTMLILYISASLVNMKRLGFWNIKESCPQPTSCGT